MALFPVRRLGGSRLLVLASPTTATVLGLIELVLQTAGLIVGSLSHQFIYTTATGVEVTLFFGGLGVVVARRQPRNPVGWLLIGFDLLLALSVIAGSYAALRYHFGHPALPLAPLAVLLVPALAVYWQLTVAGIAAGQRRA